MLFSLGFSGIASYFTSAGLLNKKQIQEEKERLFHCIWLLLFYFPGCDGLFDSCATIIALGPSSHSGLVQLTQQVLLKD